VYTSPYGDDWYQRSSVTSKNLRGVTYGDNQFVAVGENGVILTSLDGYKWTSRTSSINVDLLEAAYGNGVYAVVGNNGKILTSEDLAKWTRRSSGLRNDLSGAAFGNSRFVVVGDSEIIYSNCEQVTVAKSFNKSMDIPFDVSDRNSEIRYNEDMYNDTAGYDDVYPGHGGNAGNANNFYSSTSSTLNNSTPGKSRTAQLYNTYYIYTFDGKLLAEYDHNGNCIRDYIYAGNRLIAEYKPQTGEYFYYMTDQINSTRIITNGSGNVVFSEAYGPYGDVQKTWANTYDPKLKFSGKEREGYSDLDYFGARYCDHKSFRFNSVDPVINKLEALYNPQLWNLYAYCRNNPITYLDPDGRDILEDLKRKATQGFNQVVPNILWMDSANSEKMKRDKAKLEKALALTAGVALAFSLIDDNKDGKKGDDKNVKGGGKTGRKINEKRAQKLKEQIEEAKKEKASAKTKKEKQKIQKKIDHFRRSLKKSEEHARKSQGS
jgi:RHS repeat-associated protein